MRKISLILIVMTTVVYSCGQERKSIPAQVSKKLEKPTESQTHVVVSNHKNVDTTYEYDDPSGSHIIIENSLPKGGLKYSDPMGREYVFVIFWTSITNKTDKNLEVNMNFSADSFTVPSSPNVNFNLCLPMEEMTLEKESLPNYGLDLKSYLDENIDKPSELTTTILPNSPQLFYMVVISNEGVKGTVRAGFELQKEKLIYKINNHEINCGQIVIKNK